MSDNDTLQLVDETLRDGTQSLWGMMMSYHMMEPVLGEIAEAGFTSINGPWHGAQPMISARFFNEDPRIMYAMFRDKLKNTDADIMVTTMGQMMTVTTPPENRTLIRTCYGVIKNWLPKINQAACICCTRDEIKNEFPFIFPMFRELGIETIPYFAIGHGPRHVFLLLVASGKADDWSDLSIAFACSFAILSTQSATHRERGIWIRTRHICHSLSFFRGFLSDHFFLKAVFVLGCIQVLLGRENTCQRNKSIPLFSGRFTARISPRCIMDKRKPQGSVDAISAILPVNLCSVIPCVASPHRLSN